MQPGIEDDAIPEDPGASETHLRELHQNSRLAFIKLVSPPKKIKIRCGMGREARHRAANSVTDLPQGPAEIPMLIVARGCVEHYSCRFTHFAALAFWFT